MEMGRAAKQLQVEILVQSERIYELFMMYRKLYKI